MVFISFFLRVLCGLECFWVWSIFVFLGYLLMLLRWGIFCILVVGLEWCLKEIEGIK